MSKRSMTSQQFSVMLLAWSVGVALISGPIVAAMGASSTPSAATPADLAQAEQLYARKCSACHSIDANRIGPMHRNVVGRKAGTVPGFAYSDALKNSGITWTMATLDRWLQGPTKMVPGTRMAQIIPDPVERRSIINWLAAHSAASETSSVSEPIKAKPSEKKHKSR